MSARAHGNPNATETFWTRNVKLITFLVTVLVLLGVPTVYFILRDYKPEDPRPEMTLEELKDLAHRPKTVGIEELDAYRGDRNERKVDGVTVEVYYYITVDDRYHLDAVKVTADQTNGAAVDKTHISGAQLAYLSVYDRVTHERLDLLAKDADVDAFFED